MHESLQVSYSTIKYMTIHTLTNGEGVILDIENYGKNKTMTL